MSLDVHVTSNRSRAAKPPQRKPSYEVSPGGYDGYSGQDDWGEDWEGSWDGHGWSAHSASMGYYDEYGAYTADGPEWEMFEVDLYSMVFSLDEALQPKELYKGLEFDEKSLVITLEASDIEDQAPSSWRSRPLKIHPEPAPSSQKEKKTHTPTSLAATPVVEDGGATPSVASTATPITLQGSPAERTPKAAEASLPEPGKQDAPNVSSTATGGNTATATVPEEPFSLSPTTPVAQSSVNLGAAEQTESQNPKIVITNNQLEHLKQKMQALKQKRNLTSSFSLPASQEEDRPAAAIATSDDAQDPVTSPLNRSPMVKANCAKMHGLRLFRTPAAGWWCSICDRDRPMGATMYGCRACDFDACDQCALNPGAGKVAAGSGEQSVVSGSPLKSPLISSPQGSPSNRPSLSPRGKNTSRHASPFLPAPSPGKRAKEVSPDDASASPPRRSERKRDRAERDGGRERGHRKSRRRKGTDVPPHKQTRTSTTATASSTHRSKRTGGTSGTRRAVSRTRSDGGDSSDDEDDEEEVEETSDNLQPRRPTAATAVSSTTGGEGGSSRRRETKAASRRGNITAAPDRWEPREKRRDREADEDVRPSPRDRRRASGRDRDRDRDRDADPDGSRDTSRTETLSKRRSTPMSESDRRSSEEEPRPVRAMSPGERGSDHAGDRAELRSERGSAAVRGGGRGGGGGDDFLRRVLRANCIQGGPRRLLGAALSSPVSQGSGSVAGGAAVGQGVLPKDVPMDSDSPVSANRSAVATLKPPPNRGAGGPQMGVRKALEGLTSQLDSRKSRRG